MVIDVFSKFSYAIPIKSKSGEVIKSALQSIYLKLPENLGRSWDRILQFKSQKYIGKTWYSTIFQRK